MNNAQISTKISADKTHIHIMLSGDLTLQNSAELSQELLKTIDDFESIDVETSEVSNIDISCVQILMALRKTIEAKQRKLRVALNLPESNIELLTKAGIKINEL